MGRIELHELNARVQQSAQPAAVPMVVRHQGHPRVGMVQNLGNHGQHDCLTVMNIKQTDLDFKNFVPCQPSPWMVSSNLRSDYTKIQIAEILDGGEMCKHLSLLVSKLFLFSWIIPLNPCLLGSFIYTLMMPPLGSQWIMGSKYRKKLRTRYDLVEASYEDRISHIFCSCCSLCQEFRELKNRGFDPALGKHRTSQFFYIDCAYSRNLAGL
ncbi:LOW QUALITY PROTEIN: hypothetical protein RJ639_015975 [Escallonia herrerae]|uniref:Uncharacterized protein n=1 Tax=Escallonia herrerae TaxID=1293975 RepID=A0AA89AKE4_9ASTE|nr:LOW QUALITY PROTEIN: hypothetical protein RJ639_015975 [Escallonia herrerae]